MNIARLDPFAVVYSAPTSIPGESAPRGGVFRGMRDETKARAYAADVAAFFKQHGADGPVYVVQGPTSTTREPFEVVDACAGYSVLLRIGGKA